MSDLPVTIRPPRDIERQACRLLLPDFGRPDGPREALVAVRETTPQIAGVIGFHQTSDALLAVQVRVVHTARRRGIGSALLRAVLENARRQGVDQAFGWWRAEPDDAAAAFAAEHGFVEHSRLTTVEGPVEAVLGPVTATRDRMLSRGRIPAGARIVPFKDAPRDQVAALYAEHIIHNPQLQAILTARLEGARPLDASTVLMVGDEAAGILLWSREGEAAHVHARVIAPAYRGGWANTFLMAAALEACGTRLARFEIPGGNRDTIKLARRMRTEVRGTICHWRLARAAREG